MQAQTPILLYPCSPYTSLDRRFRLVLVPIVATQKETVQQRSARLHTVLGPQLRVRSGTICKPDEGVYGSSSVCTLLVET